jgi:hypothetical protein
MNLFRLSHDPEEAAQFYHDVHVRKIIVEGAQLLANCFPSERLELAPKTQNGNIRKHSYYNHPISKWIRESWAHYLWAFEHIKALNREYQYRFNKLHFCDHFILWCDSNPPSIPLMDSKLQPQCFGDHVDCFVANDPVKGYRQYYQKCKLTWTQKGRIVNALWTKRPIPHWIKIQNH